MIRIAGVYYDGRSSVATPAWLCIDDDTSQLYVEPGLLPAVPLNSVQVSARIGDTPRYIAFANGAKFETRDNDGVDAVASRLGPRGRRGMVYALERRWSAALILLCIVMASAWLAVDRGIPALARHVAFWLSPAANASLSQGVLEVLDRTALAPSALDSETRARLAAAFERLAASAPSAGELRLVFRQGQRLGANAFALPSGTIVVTDELVRRAENTEEIIAVLAHEIGHLSGRHALRQALQDSAALLLTTAVTGEVGTASTLAAALPVLLVETRYSRQFEREADAFAKELMQKNHIALRHFATILERIAADQHEGRGGMAFLSTHPATAERVQAFRSAQSDLESCDIE